MFNTKQTFLRLVEDYTERQRNFGFMEGDYVEIDKGKLSNKIIKKWYDMLSDDYKKAIDKVANSEYLVKIGRLNCPVPTSFGLVTGTELAGQPRFASIYEEIAANLAGTTVVVPVGILKVVKPEGNNLKPGRPKFKEGDYPNKPTEVKTDGENHNLPKVNVKIPSGRRDDGRNQIKKPTEK